MVQLIGELSAMITSLSYASSSNLYQYALIKECSPYLPNLMKGIISSLIMFLILIIFTNSVFPNDTMSNYLLLITSGILGIGIGDTFLFKTLALLGARQTILMEILAPLFTGIISYFYYGSSLSIMQWIGIFITAYGVYIVLIEQIDQKQEEKGEQIIQNNHDIELSIQSNTLSRISENNNISSNLLLQPKQIQENNNEINKLNKLYGIINGMCFTFCQSMGMVLSHDAATTSTFTSLQCSLLRTLSAIFSVAIIILLKQERIYWPCEQKQQSLCFLLGIAVGPFLGVWAQQNSLLYTRPEISQTIIATSPLFGILISWIRGEEIKIKYIIGSIISIFGVGIIIWN